MVHWTCNAVLQNTQLIIKAPNTKGTYSKIVYLFKIRHNEVNATSLNEWLKYAFATNGKVLVIIFHAVNNAEPPLPIGGLAALEQRLDGDRVDEHPILGDHFLKQIELISYSFIELG